MKDGLTCHWRHRTMYQHRRRCHLSPPPRSSRPMRQRPMQKMGATKSLERPSDVPSCLAYLFRIQPYASARAAIFWIRRIFAIGPAGATVRRPAMPPLINLTFVPVGIPTLDLDLYNTYATIGMQSWHWVGIPSLVKRRIGATASNFNATGAHKRLHFWRPFRPSSPGFPTLTALSTCPQSLHNECCNEQNNTTDVFDGAGVIEEGKR